MLAIHQPDGHEQEHAMTWLKLIATKQATDLLILQHWNPIRTLVSIILSHAHMKHQSNGMIYFTSEDIGAHVVPSQVAMNCKYMRCQKCLKTHQNSKVFQQNFLVCFSWWFFELVPDKQAWMMFYKLHTIEDDLQIFPNMGFLPLWVLNVSFMFPCCLQPDYFSPLLHRPSLEEVLRSRLLVDIGSLGSSKMLVGWRKWNAFWGMASYS